MRDFMPNNLAKICIIPFTKIHATVGYRGNHRHGKSPTNAQMNFVIVATIFQAWYNCRGEAFGQLTCLF